MNIYNFIQDARKAWKNEATISEYNTGLQAIRIVEQEYEKTHIHNLGLQLTETKAELVRIKKALSDVTAQSTRRHGEIANLNTVIQKHKSDAEKKKKRHEELIAFATDVMSSGQSCSNKLITLFNKLKNP